MKYLILAIIAIISILAGHYAPVNTQCIKGRVLVESSMYGAVVIGEQSICGRNLTFSSVSGPVSTPVY